MSGSGCGWIQIGSTLAPGGASKIPRNELWLSPISAWELLQLADRGRLRSSPDAPTWIRNSIATMAVSVAPIGIEIAIASRRIDLPHDDPADRFLAATAQILDLTLVTADERLLACREIKTLRA